MADTVSKRKRSEIMRAVKSKDTKIEIAFRKAIWRKGFRYSKNSSRYFGKPDIVLKKYKAAIFLDSCFWHGCKKHCRIPTARKKYWTKKIERNKQRDKKVDRYYKKIGWKVVRIWEHNMKNINVVISKIVKTLK
ncbi:MAG: very short patch repair endonuclease [Candidatus Nealsonbacteria bacterium CG02_land_8_20_14_3_00_37_10]|uniref:Very short patch repair endonuclease n=2 Tax=Candidatus Nealsoniibacteriota TaxID=1817911 RepID=A0A2G9YYE5_9BACT|nr:MAG: very short patch repair endonuclease [Candidatus Nealsonbacteria bacterium CG23_combo_of_CG06-09_8_20_14_all_37_18]PIV44918.1 MAG: very short patch repair endonuclease [Candidatus Nealsonbacteria bacterium CG02_land_8_20_14_3_00_37_10]